MTSDLKERLDREASVGRRAAGCSREGASARGAPRQASSRHRGLVRHRGDRRPRRRAARDAVRTGRGTRRRGPFGSRSSRWLVDAARKMADANADPTPTSAEWVLSDANTIAPAVGLTSGDPAVPRYLVVLTGHFTTNSTRPFGDTPLTGSILVAAFEPAYASADRLRHHGPARTGRGAPAILDLRVAADARVHRRGWVERTGAGGLACFALPCLVTGCPCRRRHDLERGAPRTDRGAGFHAAGRRRAVPG